MSKNPDINTQQPAGVTPEGLRQPGELSEGVHALGAAAMADTAQGGFLRNRWQAIQNSWHQAFTGRLPDGVELSKGDTVKALAYEVVTLAPIRFMGNLAMGKVMAGNLRAGTRGETFD